MNRNKIPEEIKDYLRYEDGSIYWTKKPCKKVNVGDEPKSPNAGNYKLVMFRGKSYLVHRVVWFLATGDQPPAYIDHINNDRLDNRIENLRVASLSQNQHNAKIRSDNTSGVKGVSWNTAQRKWVAGLKINNKKYYLGSFTDLEEAKQTIEEFRQKTHGEYANHG